VLVNNNRKRKSKAASSSALPDSEEDDDLVCKVDAAAGGSVRRRLRSKPKRSCDDDVNLEGAVARVNGGISVVDTKLADDNPSTTRRQSTRARKVNKKPEAK